MTKKLTIELCRQVAKKQGGLCLSEVYVNSKTNLKWKCSKGHVWNTDMTHIKHRNQWCAICAGNVKHTIELCQQIAEKKGGKCLSKVYKNSKTNLIWECSEGHEWNATFHNIKNHNRWCPYCAGNIKLTIEECREIAEERGGKCLSTKYINNESLLKWECSEGHVWNAIIASIKNQNTWCPDCGGSKKLTIEECQQIAKEQGGKCLSTKYINNKSPMKWECYEGHVWNAWFNNIKHGKKWCPYCCKSRSEKLCRKILEELTQEKFPSVRPYFLKHYKTGFNLELDGYCEKLQMAFEYHGVQHYKYFPNFFHKKGKYQFEEQKERDKLKIELCDKNNIKLIIIPYCYDYTDEQKLREFITNSL